MYILYKHEIVLGITLIVLRRSMPLSEYTKQKREVCCIRASYIGLLQDQNVVFKTEKGKTVVSTIT